MRQESVTQISRFHILSKSPIDLPMCFWNLRHFGEFNCCNIEYARIVGDVLHLKKTPNLFHEIVDFYFNISMRNSTMYCMFGNSLEFALLSFFMHCIFFLDLIRFHFGLLYVFLRVLMPLVVYHLLCAYLKLWFFIVGWHVLFFSFFFFKLSYYWRCNSQNRHAWLLFHRIYSYIVIYIYIFFRFFFISILLTTCNIITFHNKTQHRKVNLCYLSPIQHPQNERREGQISQWIWITATFQQNTFIWMHDCRYSCVRISYECLWYIYFFSVALHSIFQSVLLSIPFFSWRTFNVPSFSIEQTIFAIQSAKP